MLPDVERVLLQVASDSNRPYGIRRTHLDALVQIDPNRIAPFVQKNSKPELQKLALSALAEAGLAPRPQMKVRMKP